MRIYRRWKRELFRWGVDKGDRLDIWLQDRFDLKHPRQDFLVKMQERKSLRNLDRTIGTALNIRPA